MVDYVVTQRIPSRARARARESSALRNLDWMLLAAVAGLIAYGLSAISGITRDDVPGSPDYYFNRQAAYVFAGTVGMLGLVFVDPQLYRRYWRWLYGGLLLVLLAVPFVGEDIRNTRRWISLGPVQFQPSELGKLVVILCLAAFLADRGRRIGERGTVLTATALAVAPMMLVFLQPDVGTAVVYAAALFGTLFIAGTRWLHLTALLGGAALLAVIVLWAAPALGADLLEPYQRERITGFLNPSESPQDSTYNITQSITAVGAGGVDGRGVSGATQTNQNYLPEHATDFVFASVAEQRGFLGVSILLLLYLLVIWRAIKVITAARDLYAATVAGGIVLVLLVQIFINVGMTIGMAPITGIPLPFVSAGGSSMVANLLAIGVLQAIAVRRR